MFNATSNRQTKLPHLELTLSDQKTYPYPTQVEPIQPFLYALTDPSGLLLSLPLKHPLGDRRHRRVVALLDVLEDPGEAIVVVMHLGRIQCV